MLMCEVVYLVIPTSQTIMRIITLRIAQKLHGPSAVKEMYGRICICMYECLRYSVSGVQRLLQGRKTHKQWWGLRTTHLLTSNITAYTLYFES